MHIVHKSYWIIMTVTLASADTELMGTDRLFEIWIKPFQSQGLFASLGFTRGHLSEIAQHAL